MRSLSKPHIHVKITGFSLMEVLIALLIIAIALTALLKAIGSNISSTAHIKEKTLVHFIAMQGIAMIQLGLIKVAPNQTITEVTNMLGERRYWRASLKKTSIPSIQEITIKVGKHQTGPFNNPIIGFRTTVHE